MITVAERTVKWNESALKGIYRRLEQSEESVDLKTGQLKWSLPRGRTKKNEGKWTQPKESLGNHQVHQHTHHGSLRKREGRKEEKTISRYNGTSPPNMMKDMHLHIQEI